MNKIKLSGLYAIADTQLIPQTSFKSAIEQALLGGARLIQYRDKSNDALKRLLQARTLRDLCHHYAALLIINDDVELAIQCAADGVHLGKDDTPYSAARHQLGANAIIGVSCYNTIERAISAQSQGADYVAFGAIYTSATKPDAPSLSLDTLRSAVSRLSIPVCAIGGINTQNAAAVTSTGVDMIAVISDLFGHDDIRARSEALSKLFM